MLVRFLARAILWLSKKSGLAASSDPGGSKIQFPHFAKSLLERLSIGFTTQLWTRSETDVLAAGLRLRIPASDVSLYWTLHADNYEPFTLECIRRCIAAHPGRDVIDVGANIGVIACVAGSELKRTGGGLVHAFEPDTDNRRYLTTNIGLNGLNDVVTPHAQAMGAAPGWSQLFRARSHGLHSLVPGLLRSPIGSTEVEVTSLDALISGGVLASVTSVSLVKVDTEGYEGEVLAGAELFNRRFAPFWIIEYYEPGFRGSDDKRAAFWQRLSSFCGAIYYIDELHATLRPWSENSMAMGPNFYANLLCAPTHDDVSRLGVPTSQPPDGAKSVSP